MSYVLGMVFWALGIRGHIPQFGDYHPVRAGSPVALPVGAVMGVFAAAVATLSAFALTLWAAVWLATKLI
jgi:hypothetical protein